MSKILVVDDAEFMRMRYRKLLAGEGYEVIEAADGREAISVYERENPDLVLMDITMPVMDGLEALKELKALDSDALIVMSSALGQERVVLSAIKDGAKDFLVKPFKPENVLDTLKKHLA